MKSPKYNRTLHLPWSEGVTKDDKIAKDINSLIDTEIVISEKIDGSNSSLESIGCFARTHAGPPTHLSFDGLKAFHAQIKHLIPNNIQLFGEWAFAVHSIKYSSLPNYFLLFNVRDNNSLSWLSIDEVIQWANVIGAPTTPILFRGVVKSENELKNIVKNLVIQPSACGDIKEGIVIRVANTFADENFSKCVAKWVRKDHVTTEDHWKNQSIIKNGLK